MTVPCSEVHTFVDFVYGEYVILEIGVALDV
jgi:hypothetical protein